MAQTFVLSGQQGKDFFLCPEVCTNNVFIKRNSDYRLDDKKAIFHWFQKRDRFSINPRQVDRHEKEKTFFKK